ncbi:hypothetical protein HA402_006323 [Bradysia odoriphaga]|nr:hypothetical protein HA402_006323 [Bradysia odoriphaga]
MTVKKSSITMALKPSTVYHRDNTNKNALHYCSGQRDLVAAASVAIAAPELLESADEDGFTPLHLAVIQGNMALVNLLLANKTDVNALDNEGHSVVHWATVCGEVEALRAVLAAGADVSTPDINGGSPLHYAAQMCGAHYDGKSGLHSSRLALEILSIFLHHPHTVVDVIDKDGRQPLLWAASAGSARAVMALVKAGARIECSDKDGLTALHCAASRGHTECIDTLISLCGAPTDLIDSNGCTALHYAVTLGHADATSVLLDLEADPNRQDRKGRTPAHCGCAKGQFETVRMLRERKANMWLRNAKGDLPIHEAASSGRRELVEWLLEQKPRQVNITSNDGRTILHIAAGNDYTDMCKMLLDFGADVNSIYRTSRNVVMTPLDCALQKGFRSTAKFLQLHGGLPASKLRLSGRKPNALNDQELVKPLSFTTNETKSEQQTGDTKNSKHFVVYLKRSESDEHSCEEKVVPKSHQSRCDHHHHHRHRYRFRTSSVETFKQKDDSSSDMCRSKSNIEIHRRRKSRHRRGSSSVSEDSCSSSEGCSCHKYRKRDKHKHKKREKATSRHVKSKSNSKSSNDDDSDSDDKRSKRKDKKSKKSNTSADEVAAKAKDTRKENKTKNKSENRKEAEQTKESDAPAESKVNEKVVKRPQSAKLSSAQKRSQEQNKRPVDDVNSKVETKQAAQSDASVDGRVNTETIVTKADVHSEDVKPPSNENVQPTVEVVVDESVKPPSNDKNINEPVKVADGDLTDSTYTVDNKPKDVGETVQVEQLNSKKNESQNVVANEQPVQTNDTCIPSAAKTDQTNENEHNDESVLPVSNNTAMDNKPADGSELLPTADQSFEVIPDGTLDNELRPSPEREEQRKSSFTVLASDESIDHEDPFSEIIVKQDRSKSFQILGSFDKPETATNDDEEDQENLYSSDDDVDGVNDDNLNDEYDMVNRAVLSGGTGRRKRLKKRVKSVSKQFSVDVPNQLIDDAQKQLSKDHDSGFEPSPRALRTKIPSPRTIYTAVMPRKSVFANLDGRSCVSRLEGRKPGDKNSVNMSTVTQSIQKNIRRYYMERKIFQHLLELKSLQIRSSKINESVLVKRAVDDYHKSTLALGLETGGSLRRYPYKDYTFKNFEIFLYETLKSLQKTGTYNFQNISDVYKEAERRLSPDYSRYEKALQCTSKTHRCLHSAQAYLSRPAHAYTGIPCAAYIPTMRYDHHTIPKYGFGPLKSAGLGSFYLPKISTKNGKGDKVSLELSHGNNKQLISLPSEKLDSNKRYYVTFTVKGNENNHNNNTTREQSNKG